MGRLVNGILGSVVTLATLVATAATVPTSIGCRQCPSCLPNLDVIQACIATGSCAIDGTAITSCALAPVGKEEGNLCYLTLAPHSKLTIDLARLRSTIGSRTRMVFGYIAVIPPGGDPYPPFTFATVSFDDAQSTTCAQGAFAVVCPELPPSASKLSVLNGSNARMAYLAGEYMDQVCIDAVLKACPPG